MPAGSGKMTVSPDRQGGFSLIELAVVLMVIGLLISAVTVGRNVMRTAEMSRIFSDGVSHWSKSIYIYYERYGRILGDTGNVCSDNITCSVTLRERGLTGGFDNDGLARIPYVSAQGAAGFVQLIGVVPAPNRTSAVVTLQDTLGREGLLSIQGLVNGRDLTTTAPFVMTFTMSQFAANN